MKIKNGFVLRKIASDYVVVPTGQEIVDFRAVITLNETAAFMWNKLLDGISKEDLVKAVAAEYGEDEKTVEKDADEFLSVLREKKIIN